MTYENIVVEIRDRIARVTLSRPKVLNALNEKTILEIRACSPRSGTTSRSGRSS
jgi:enoyl-CoA hydratase